MKLLARGLKLNSQLPYFYAHLLKLSIEELIFGAPLFESFDELSDFEFFLGAEMSEHDLVEGWFVFEGNGFLFVLIEVLALEYAFSAHVVLAFLIHPK